MQSQKLKDRLIRPKEAAFKLGVARQTLYTWVNDGILPPPLSLGPRVTGWQESRLDEFLRQQEAASTAAHAARLEARAKKAAASSA